MNESEKEREREKQRETENKRRRDRKKVTGGVKGTKRDNIRQKKSAGREKRAREKTDKIKLEMFGGIVSHLGSVNPLHICSLCKFIFTCLQS